MCKWESQYVRDYRCDDSPLDGDPKGYCILHAEDDKKDLEAFRQKVEGRIKTTGDKIDLCGCYFPVQFPINFKGHIFNKPVVFSEAIFSQKASFVEATFSESANFNLATFSKGASFWETIFFGKASFQNATFSETGVFLKAYFDKEVEFAGARFEKEANFDQTSFKGKTDFTWAEFWDWTFFFKNSNETSVKLENLNVVFPNYLKEKIGCDTLRERLIFVGVMSTEERDQLLELSQGDSYKSAIKELFERSQGLYLGNPAIFCYTRFLGKEVIFQDGNLSRCSFLHSNIDKVDFRYCEFAKKDERLLWVFPHQRQNVLMDELEADELLEGSQDSMSHSERSEESRPFAFAQGDRNKKLRGEKYEPVRRLYLELKRNFEDKKDWNTAGDFHYGEMECRRKGRLGGWLDFFLVNAYYGASGYGERPLRALLCILFSIFLFFPWVYSKLDTLPRQGYEYYFWELSVKASFLQRIGEEGNDPLGLGSKLVYLLQSALCPVLIALFILALRRKVKR